MHRNTKKKQKSVYIYFLDNFFKKTHCLNGHEFEQSLGVGEGQGGLAFCSPWGGKELDMTE